MSNPGRASSAPGCTVAATPALTASITEKPSIVATTRGSTPAIEQGLGPRGRRAFLVEQDRQAQHELRLAEKSQPCIVAIAVAFEVQARVRLASTGLKTGQGCHKPGTTGTFGALAGCAKLLGLTHPQTLMALGLAGSRAGSMALNTGTMTSEVLT